jgi:ABC-2 type transport system permease protein
MSRLAIALKKEYLEQLRTYRLLIAGAVLLLFGLASPLLAKLTPELLGMLPEVEGLAALIPEPSTRDAVAQYLENVSQFGVILALLLTMGVVAQEKDKGTAAMMLVKPLTRSHFLAAKFMATATTFAVSLALAGLACWYYTLLLFEPIPFGPWLALNGLIWLMIMVYVAITLLCSVLARSVTAAGGLAFGALILVGLLSVVPQLGRLLPGALARWGAELVLASLPGAAAAPEPAWAALAASLGLIATALIAAGAIFKRQEL